MNKKFTKLIAALALLVFMTPSMAGWGQTRDNYNVTYNYSDLENMLSGDYVAVSGSPNYYKVPETAGNSATIAIPITVQPTSNITLTFRIATFGSGTNPSSSNTTITAVGTETGSNWTGSGVSSYPSSSTYVNGTMTITKPDTPTTLGGLTVTMGVNSGVKIFRLQSITVSYEYAPTVTAPTISPDSQWFSTSVDVTITPASGTTGYYTTDGTDPSSSNGTEITGANASFTVSATTTVKAIAYKDSEASSISSATYNKIFDNIAALTATSVAGEYQVNLSDAVVTYVNGSYSYIQDASGAVVYYKSEHGLTAGNVFNGTVTVSYQKQNNNPRITSLSGVTPVSGLAPDPTSLKQSEWSYTFNNVLSQYLEITRATITTSSSKYYVSLGGENVQLYKASGSISSLDLTKTYTITGFPTLYNSTKEIQIFADPEEEVISDPTILVTPATLSGFTYGYGEGPSTTKTISVSGTNLNADISLSLGESSNFEMSTTASGTYSNTLTLTQESGAVEATTIYVRLKAGLFVNDSYSGTITLTSTNATDETVSLSGSVTVPEALNVAWNLSTASYVTSPEPTENLIQWTSSFVTMKNEKNTGSTSVINYIPPTYTSTRFYKNNKLTITPTSGYAIDSVVFVTTTEGYATTLTNSTWKNATASANTTDKTVTVTPTYGCSPFSAVLGNTCGVTSVKVYYGYTKPIAAPATWTGGSGGYYLIASPVLSVTPSASNGFLTTAKDYDLYSFGFDQEANRYKWRNYKATNFNIESGKGYLYANEAADTLVFAGVPYYAGNTCVIDLEYTAGKILSGWNLIGNPFECNATLNKPFYRMKSTGDGFVSVTEGSIVNAMEGVFVKATDTGQSATFTASRGGAKSIAKTNIRVSGTNGTLIDNAIIRFDGGETLEKFMFNENDTKLYIPQGSQDYSIVCSNAEGEMPVNFKAAENGSYTLSFNTENVEMDYLHLIDNMTGADIDLLQTPSYTFNARTTDYASRFRLVFNATGSMPENTEGSETFAFFNGSEWVVNASANATLQVVDMMGRIVLSTNGANTVSTNGMAQGVYVMRLVNGNDVKTQKIVVQ
jgi:hypothetical protein